VQRDEVGARVEVVGGRRIELGTPIKTLGSHQPPATVASNGSPAGPGNRTSGR
jgi:hypothetical protein